MDSAKDAKDATTAASTNTTAAETVPSEPKPKKTRLLKEVEEEENKKIFEMLYQAIETEEEKETAKATTDITIEARESTKLFYAPVQMSVSEKLKAIGKLQSQPSKVSSSKNNNTTTGTAAAVPSPAVRRHNAQVCQVLVFTSLLLFTLPVAVLLYADRVLDSFSSSTSVGVLNATRGTEERGRADSVYGISLQSSLLSVATVMAIMGGYMLYALCIERPPSELQADDTKKKNQ